MRTYQDTDIEISNLVSCNVCGNWYWSKFRSMFICDGCRELRKKQTLERSRQYNGDKYQLSPESIERANNIFRVLVEYRNTGIKPEDLKRECRHRGYIGWNITDIHVTLERANVLVWLDDEGRLYPYKNLNTGERYE